MATCAGKMADRNGYASKVVTPIASRRSTFRAAKTTARVVLLRLHVCAQLAQLVNLYFVGFEKLVRAKLTEHSLKTVVEVSFSVIVSVGIGDVFMSASCGFSVGMAGL